MAGSPRFATISFKVPLLGQTWPSDEIILARVPKTRSKNLSNHRHHLAKVLQCPLRWYAEKRGGHHDQSPGRYPPVFLFGRFRDGIDARSREPHRLTRILQLIFMLHAAPISRVLVGHMNNTGTGVTGLRSMSSLVLRSGRLNVSSDPG
jgi:hypothetical protein